MKRPLVGVIMGSDSDLATMQQAVDVLLDFGVPHEVRVVSAHRTPRDMERYASTAERRGLRVIIAGAGGAAHLPGMVASYTTLPVVGVPVESKALRGLDSLLSIAQMPAGIPVAAVAIGNARNAGLLAVRILSTSRPRLRGKLRQFHWKLASESRKKDDRLRASGHHVSIRHGRSTRAHHQ
jgi:5-(carboxyamino)imidazole ribonucleotide mutase